MAKHYRNHDPFEEVKFVTSFVSASPLKLKPCPSGHQTVVLKNGRDSTNLSFEKENFCAMDMPKVPTLGTKKNSLEGHESFSFDNSHVSCSLLKSLEFVSLVPMCFYEDPTSS